MTAVHPEQDVDTIEHLDFEHEIPCDYDGHSRFGAGAAVWLVRFKGIPCGHARAHQMCLCDKCLQFLHTKRFRCIKCGDGNYKLSEFVAEVRPLHP